MADRNQKERLNDVLRIDIHRFWSQLAEHLRNGESLNASVVQATASLTSEEFKSVAAKISTDLENGTPLYNALAKYPQFFSKGVVGLIRSGIESNRLPEISANVAAGLAVVANRAKSRNTEYEDEKQLELNMREKFEKRRSRIETWIKSMFENAVRQGASHIHIEPRQNGGRCAFRVIGLMEPYQEIEQDDYDSIMFGLKRQGNIMMLGPIYPQVGSMFTRVDGRQIDVLMNVSLSHYGEMIVIRLFDRGQIVPELQALGLNASQLQELLRWQQSDAGIILACGPTTCGKSSTLFGYVNTLRGRGLKIATAEKNLQYIIPDITHVRIKPEANLDYPEAITVHKDQNVNILLVDDVRSADIAKSMVEAAKAGMLVLSCVQAGGAPEGLSRFCEMEVGSYQIRDLVLGVIGQRLARRLCQSCKKEHTLTDQESLILQQMGLDNSVTSYEGLGCDDCQQTGFKGGVAFYELMPMSDTLATALESRQGSRPVRAAAQQDGMVNLKQSGFAKVLEGEISVAEFLRNANSVFLS